MSDWQSQFDANGPSWDGNAAAIEEEKRLQKLMEESNGRGPSPSCDPSVLEKMEQEMRALKEQERKLLDELDQCKSTQEKMRIEDSLSTTRKTFYEVKDRYVQLRNPQT